MNVLICSWPELGTRSNTGTGSTRPRFRIFRVKRRIRRSWRSATIPRSMGVPGIRRQSLDLRGLDLIVHVERQGTEGATSEETCAELAGRARGSTVRWPLWVAGVRCCSSGS
jgi:hypothetical protein